MTTDEMIAVMQASKEGKIIECASKNSENWSMAHNPSWNWRDFKYRVKPEPKCRPYKNAEEFLQAQKEHGPYIKFNGEYFFVDRVQSYRILWRNFSSSKGNEKKYEELYREYTWQDGTLCGIMGE